MKRNPRKVRWTKAFRKASGKEMTVDSTLEFEKRRHIPIRYDRELMSKTLEAMSRVAEIKKKREIAFYNARMRASRKGMSEKSSRNLKDRNVLQREEHLKPTIEAEKLKGEEIRRIREVAREKERGKGFMLRMGRKVQVGVEMGKGKVLCWVALVNLCEFG